MERKAYQKPKTQVFLLKPHAQLLVDSGKLTKNGQLSRMPGYENGGDPFAEDPNGDEEQP